MPHPSTSCPTAAYHPDVKDYFLLNGFDHHSNKIIPQAMLFIKDRIAVLLVDDSIDVKTKPTEVTSGYLDVLFNWESVKHYKGGTDKISFN